MDKIYNVGKVLKITEVQRVYGMSNKENGNSSVLEEFIKVIANHKPQ